METKQSYNIIYYRSDNGTILECRQCSHKYKWDAAREATLYSKWAEFHYDCEVFYKINEQ
jgi:hypothetical protein